jgi:hypothetical protein
LQGGEEAVDAAGAGVDFLALRSLLVDGKLAALCDSVPVPVFVRASTPEAAFALGASGINEIAA